MNTELIIIRYLDWFHRWWNPGWFDMMTEFTVCKNWVDLVSGLVLFYVNTELIRYHDRFDCIWRLRWFEINNNWFYRMWILSWLLFDILTGFIVGGIRVDSIWWLSLPYVKIELIWYQDWSCSMWIPNWFDIMTGLIVYEDRIDSI